MITHNAWATLGCATVWGLSGCLKTPDKDAEGQQVEDAGAMDGYTGR